MSGIFGSAARVGGKQRINNGAVRAKGTGTGQGGTEHRGRATTEPPQSHQTATMLPARTVLLLSLLLTFSLHHAAAHFAPVECCFEYAQKPIRHPQSFYETSKDCPKPAVVIVAASGDEICADPKKSWVKKVIKRLQKEKLNPSTI